MGQAAPEDQNMGSDAAFFVSRTRQYIRRWRQPLMSGFYCIAVVAFHKPPGRLSEDFKLRSILVIMQNWAAFPRVPVTDWESQ
jgi:hypothetical protein